MMMHMDRKAFHLCKYLWQGALLLSLALTAAVADAKTDTDLERKPWSLDEAVALVDAKHEGAVLRVRQINAKTETCPVYRVRLLTSSGRVKSYFVDGCLRDFVKAPAKSSTTSLQQKG